MTDNIVCFDKKIYTIDAIFRAIVDSKLFNYINIEEDCKSYIVIFNKSISLNESQEFIGNANIQMVRVKLEERFDCIRKMIVERALGVNRGRVNE